MSCKQRSLSTSRHPCFTVNIDKTLLSANTYALCFVLCHCAVYKTGTCVYYFYRSGARILYVWRSPVFHPSTCLPLWTQVRHGAKSCCVGICVTTCTSHSTLRHLYNFTRAGRQTKVINLILAEIHGQYVYNPPANAVDAEGEESVQGYEGATVIDTKKGFYNGPTQQVVLLDYGPCVYEPECITVLM